MQKNKRLLFVLCIIISCLLFSCQEYTRVGNRLILNQTKERKPIWTNELVQNNPDYFLVMGSGQNMTLPEKAHKTAYLSALHSFIQTVPLLPRHRITAIPYTPGFLEAERFSLKTPAFTIKDIVLVDHYFIRYKVLEPGIKRDENTYTNSYVLLGIPKSEITRIQQEQEMLLRQSFSLYEEADRLYKQAKIFLAYKTCTRGLQLMESIFLTLDIRFNNGRSYNYSEIHSRLKMLQKEFTELLKIVILDIQLRPEHLRKNAAIFFKTFKKDMRVYGLEVRTAQTMVSGEMDKYFIISGEVLPYKDEQNKDPNSYSCDTYLKLVHPSIRPVAYESIEQKMTHKSEDKALSSLMHLSASEAARFYSKSILSFLQDLYEE